MTPAAITPNGVSNGSGPAQVNGGPKPNEPGVPTPLALKVIIVGAGIGGLAAAISLRRKGHSVVIYERSQFKAEHGAAITMAPYATAALESLGIDVVKAGAVQGQAVSSYDHGRLIRTFDIKTEAHRWETLYRMVHRVDLHNLLREAAVDPKGLGPPAELHLGSRVKIVDPTYGMVVFEDGTVDSADVVVGADGIWSATRSAISDAKPFPSGKSAFRFTINLDEARANPEISDFLKLDGEMKVMSASDRQIIMYPCRGGKILSVAVVHPDGESDGSSTEWSQVGDKATMLRCAESFGPEVAAVLRMADAKTVKVWKLNDMIVLQEWTKGSLCLLGDASHPFMPYQGAGGAMAIEDAIALAEVLELGTSRDQVPSRLKLYQKIRQERANRIQDATRFVGRSTDQYLARERHAMGTMLKGFLHNEFHNSTHKVRQHAYESGLRTSLSTPLGFGPTPTIRQDSLGQVQANEGSKCRTVTVRFNTSRTLLQNLLPNKRFDFSNDGDTVLPAILKVQEMSNLAWLGGGGYRTFGIYVPGVRYSRTDGTTVQGTFPLAIFSDSPEAVTSDREELGLPAFYAAINTVSGQDGKSFAAEASWRGTTFGTLKVENIRKGESEVVAGTPDDSLLTWRYMAAAGASSKAYAEHALSIPCLPSSTRKQGVSNISCAEASFSWHPASPRDLPTLGHVVQRLAELPVHSIISAVVENDAPAPSYAGAVEL